MNKQECKKYFRRAYKRLITNNKPISISNIENEMNNVIDTQKEEYIAYSKIAIHNMQKSGNVEIGLKDLLSQIDILPRIFKREIAINKANTLVK